MNNTRKWLLYATYIMVAAAFFIYYLFPSNTVKNYLTSNLNKAYPGIDVTIDHVKPAFPPGLRFYNVNFYHINDFLLDVEQIKIVPSFFSLFRSKTNFFFKGRTGEGIFEGKGELTKNRPSRKVIIDGKLSGIQIKEIAALKNLAGRNISGILNGDFTYRGDNKSGGNLRAKLIASDCELELLTPVFKLESLTFSKIAADLVMKNGELQVKQCIITGDQTDGSLSGSVTLKKPMGKSYLKLSGTIKPDPYFLADLGKDLPANLLPKKIFGKNGFPIRIYGTLDKPRFLLR